MSHSNTSVKAEPVDDEMALLPCNPDHDIVGEIKTIAYKAQIVRLIQGINEKVPGANISTKGTKKEVTESLTERLEEWREASDGFGWEAAWAVYEVVRWGRRRRGGVVGLETEDEDSWWCCISRIRGRLGDGESDVTYIERDGDSTNLPVLYYGFYSASRSNDYLSVKHRSERSAEDFTFWLGCSTRPEAVSLGFSLRRKLGEMRCYCFSVTGGKCVGWQGKPEFAGRSRNLEGKQSKFRINSTQFGVDDAHFDVAKIDPRQAVPRPKGAGG
ncbi:hypothetical protein C8R46DRAFT_1036210 [Mycena filopes]|nr:hypothetical protein C8R46DRAFT_1036210 [Mycena filopes]